MSAPNTSYHPALVEIVVSFTTTPLYTIGHFTDRLSFSYGVYLALITSWWNFNYTKTHKHWLHHWTAVTL